MRNTGAARVYFLKREKFYSPSNINEVKRLYIVIVAISNTSAKHKKYTNAEMYDLKVLLVLQTDLKRMITN